MNTTFVRIEDVEYSGMSDADMEDGVQFLTLNNTGDSRRIGFELIRL
ncbi:Unannotated [Lentimonas sp. CC19]|nr:Unannotated [Lentimonas sp. CC4]CAA6686613.1 Unannotated [Lentimonas sp. CC6]CAA6696263.1 Unannotated [Lentimonas sp. CC10]CAA6697469.1 Unannotated [Lentimonas sp. CC19]CAA7071219.1 Unannotated [Lentimonas sp. CC11]CAA7168026.1 Unannotated [Lentimonas sp. CC21]CAA7183029.1 Unannotated [Lentimonas sp. CC8]